ncbi:MAG: hypothetical protein K2N51_14395, partial [Lachnospiraceae bacterium]|nr:hypothetical protein [Lachnospiraceae bacterium]
LMKRIIRCRFFLFTMMLMIICVGTNIQQDKVNAVRRSTLKVKVTVSKNSQIIPSESNRSGVDIVNNAKVLYQVEVKAVCKYPNGAPVSRRKIKFSDPNTQTVKKVGWTAKTNANGIAYATYEVRGAVDFKVNATVDDEERNGDVRVDITGSGTETIDVIPKSKYEHKFRITAYCTAKESEYSGAKTSAPGLSGTYKKKFLEAVKVNGSGLTEGGENIIYNDATDKYSKNKPITASGTTPVANKTIAASSFCIPKLCVDGTWQRGCITIAGIEKDGKPIYYRAEDSGGDFWRKNDWNIDVYVGIGASKAEKFDARYNTDKNGKSDRMKVVTYLGNNKNLW